MSAISLDDPILDRLKGLVPDIELDYSRSLVREILRLKQERRALVLGHNYMEPALFNTVPDMTGDSLELCRRAATTDAPVIVFCGVRFMAETAKILNPERTVLLPAAVGGCSLAASITAADVRELRRRYPGVPIVAYINTYADVKAEVDICCTSGNAARVVNSLAGQTVIFLPDEYLARNVARETGRHVILPVIGDSPQATAPVDTLVEQVMIGWRGRCEVHEQFTVEDIAAVRAQHPGTVILAHPECSPEVTAASDFSGSTREMTEYVQHTQAESFLLLTECSMSDNIAAMNPDKKMLGLCSVRCPHMNEIRLADLRDSLLHVQHEIHVPEDIRVRALRSVTRMLEL